MPVSSTNSTTRLEHCAWFAVFPSLFHANASSCTKPLSNGLASRGTLTTWMYFPLRLTWLDQVFRAQTCKDLRSVWPKWNFHARDASCLLFGHVTQVGWLPFVHSCWSRRKAPSLVMGFCMSYLYVWSPNASRVSTQVQLAFIWESVWTGLNVSDLLDYLQTMTFARTLLFPF